MASVVSINHQMLKITSTKIAVNVHDTTCTTGDCHGTVATGSMGYNNYTSALQPVETTKFLYYEFVPDSSENMHNIPCGYKHG